MPEVSRSTRGCVLALSLLLSTGCMMELTHPRERLVIRGPKAPLPDDPDGKRTNENLHKRANTKLGRFFQKLPDANFTFDPWGTEQEKKVEKSKPYTMPPPADPR